MISLAVRRLLDRTVKVDSGCWVCSGSPTGGGYVPIRDGFKRIPAHRVSWEFYEGPIPEGLLVLHKCDNPPCVNPDHLFLGTHKDNVADMILKERDVYDNNIGEGNGRSILTEKDVIKIKLLLKQDIHTHGEIGDMFGVTREAITRINCGKSWRHI